MALVTTPVNTNRGTQVGSLSLANAGTYVTGGITCNAAMFSMNQLFSLDVNPDSGFIFEYIPTSGSVGKLKMFESGTASAVLNEVANAATISSVTAARYEAIGA